MISYFFGVKMNFKSYLLNEKKPQDLEADWVELVNNWEVFFSTWSSASAVSWQKTFNSLYSNFRELQEFVRLSFCLKNLSPIWTNVCEQIDKEFNELEKEVKTSRIVYKKIALLIERTTLLKWQTDVIENSGFYQTSSWSTLEERNEKHQIAKEIKFLENKISANVVNGLKDEFVFVDMKSQQELKGIPAYLLKRANKRALEKNKNGFVFEIKDSEYETVMTFCKNRQLRKRFYTLKCKVAGEVNANGKFDNSSIVKKLLKKRKQESNLWGFDDYAHMALSGSILDNQEKVLNFLDSIAEKLYPKVEEHFNELKSFAISNCSLSRFEPWDYSFVKQQLKDVSFGKSEETTIYLPFSFVLKNTMKLLSELFNFKFSLKEEGRANCIWSCSINGQNKNGTIWFIGKKSSKEELYSGPFDVDIVFGEEKRTALSVVFLQRQDNSWSHEDLIYLIHEIGHALQNILTQPKHEVLGLQKIPGDAIEVFSQLFEFIVWDKDLLGKIIGRNRAAKMSKNQLIDNGERTSMLMEQVVLAITDVKMHTSYNPNGQCPPWLVLSEVKSSVVSASVKSYDRTGNRLRMLSGVYPCAEYSYLLSETFSCMIWEKMSEIAESKGWVQAFCEMKEFFFDSASQSDFVKKVESFSEKSCEFGAETLISGRETIRIK